MSDVFTDYQANVTTDTQANTYQRTTAEQIAEDLLILANNIDKSKLGISTYQTESYSSIGNISSHALSGIEQAIMTSQTPIELNNTEEITVNGHRGLWANKAESINWKGELPITEYSVNEDPEPELITKKSQQKLIYNQEVAIRYLRPPTPPAPGEIVVQQEKNEILQPAPPLIIRQQPPRPVTPQPLVVREAPPEPPINIGRKVITISGKKIPPPPRKVVIERLAPLPAKPQSVIIERWLPYNQVKRRVIFQKSIDIEPVALKPKNVIIQWESPHVQVKKEFKDLGVIRANPLEYIQRYGSTLKTARDLPSFVSEIKPPEGVILASDFKYNQILELEGDLDALRFVDLELEGLGEYRGLVERLEMNERSISNNSNNKDYNEETSAQFIAEMFSMIDRDNNGKVSIDEAEKILLKLNSRLGRNYNYSEVENFFSKLDTNRDHFIDMEEFRVAFQSSL